MPGNPCAFGGMGSHHTMLLLPPGSAIETGPQDITALLRPNHYANLPRSILRNLSEVSVLCFSPVRFCGNYARQVSCYTLFEGLLLLSIPPCCLGVNTHFGLTLSKNLGTLTSVWVKPLSVVNLTSHEPVSLFLRCVSVRSLNRG